MKKNDVDLSKMPLSFSLPTDKENRKINLGVFTIILPILAILVCLSTMYGTGDNLSVQKVLIALSNTDLTYLFRYNLDNFRKLYSEFLNGNFNVLDFLDLAWTCIKLVFVFGFNIIYTIFKCLEVLFLLISGV